MKRIISVLVTAVMIFTAAFQCSFAAQVTAEEAYSSTGKTIYENTVQNIAKESAYGSEWHILGLARSEYAGCDEIFEKYYEDVVKKIKDSKGVLSKNKYTEYSRTIVAVKAIGRNPKNTGGYDVTAKLLEKENVAIQGLNGPIWALIALNTGGYADSSAEFKKTAKEYTAYILEAEKDGGGWSLNSSETNADTDITAMALTALAPYYKGDSRVKESADRAVLWLSENQNSDGTYSSWGTVNSESCAQVTVALTSLGIDPNKDERFIKNGKSVIDGLLGFYTDGGFKHVSTGKLNAMATEQGYYALTAYFRFTGGKTSLYDMSDTGDATPAALTKANIVSVKSVSGKGVKITWNKVKTAKGYQIKYSAKKNMTDAKTATSGSLSKKITKLKSGKRYYFKVRAYKTADGSRIYGGWSSTKSVKVK
ncbi:MAG: fibronectin type III domain-containing protein [Eubacteriales bacterium]|nr:fibronectin type III domain-containing protein [Eubacteriales bacterium]